VTLLAAIGCGNSTGGSPGRGGSSGAGANGGAGGTGLTGSGTSGRGASAGRASGAGGADAGAGGVAGASATPGSGGHTAAAGSSSAAGKSSAGGTAGDAGHGQAGGVQGVAGMTSDAGAGGGSVTSSLVTSAHGVWTSATWTETPGDTADVTVDDTAEAQTWEGFGGAFHEMGFNLLTTSALVDEAMALLFGADGARLSLARIPIGASDYALERYTLDDTDSDVTPDRNETNRPPADLELSRFSIERDKQTLIPYLEAALVKNPKLRFWAAAWTPPVWMKIGYKSTGVSGEDPASKPSYFDGGSVRSDAATLAAYARYMVKFIQAYREEGITVDAIAPQNDPTFEQNYPSCLWDPATYTTYVGQYLGPALASANLGTKVMAGFLANVPPDDYLLTAVMAEPAARSFVGSIGVEWAVLDKLESTPLTYGVPVWVTEQKCGNYPFITSPINGSATTPPIPAYTEPPPNDQAYGIETWWYIRDAITKAKVTAYNFPHLVLDTFGLGNDTSREWAQNSLLVVDGGKLVATQAYYVARHFSQYVDPGAKVLATSGGDAVAFKNPDGSLVAVVFSSEAKSDFTVALGGKKLSFAIPAGGWATLKYKP
jgi:glucosylceramidase